jgi:SAM-dependent methyltransferase
VSDPDLRAAQAGSFGAAADVYERGRPGYPEAALDWLLRDEPARVLDLGAGTGKLTRQLSARGLDVVAVEPSEGMRTQFAGVLPDVPVLAGTAEAIPLVDHSVDAVLVAQAWHWVDVARASVEVGRVLRPGGTLGLVWNQRDDSVAWVAKLSKITRAGVEHFSREKPPVLAPLGDTEHHRVRWSTEITPATLLDMVASRSYMIIAEASERDRILRAVGALLADEPELAGRERFAMPYVTLCTRARVIG